MLIVIRCNQGAAHRLGGTWQLFPRRFATTGACASAADSKDATDVTRNKLGMATATIEVTNNRYGRVG